VRDRIYGLLQFTVTKACFIGLIRALTVRASVGWRAVCLITGTVGALLSMVVFLEVRERPLEAVGQRLRSWRRSASTVFR